MKNVKTPFELRKEVGIDAETITRRTVAAYEKLLKE